MRFTRLLGFKLFLIIAGVMLVGALTFTTFTIRWHSDQYLSNSVATAGRISDVIKRSMHYSMLLNRRDDIRHIINTIGNEPGMEAIRIYNKKGEITFSSRSSEVGTVANVGDVACKACHAGPSSPDPKLSDLTRIFPSDSGYQIIGMITPIQNESACATADCHAHPESQTVLGVLDVMMPLRELDKSLAELSFVQSRNALFMAAAVMVFSGLFIWLMVNEPVKRLIRGTEQVRKGNLDHRISLKNHDEIGTLALSFNQMTDDLRRARNELTEWARLLEKRVQEKTEELRRAHANMVQMEKMVSLGTLAATVAHELNNPLEGVLTYAKVLKRTVTRSPMEQGLKKELEQELSIIADESARCGNIVKNLLLFSRHQVGEFKESNLIEVLERSLRLVAHHLTMNNIKLERNFKAESLPLVCDPHQLEQALLAVEINSVEAMPDGGVLTISVTPEDQSAMIRIDISDTGVGIRNEDLPHVFEPFFTTKHDGKGTGLGLAVVYGIVKRHGGTVEIRSQITTGTTLSIRLPRQPANQPAHEVSFLGRES